MITFQGSSEPFSEAILDNFFTRIDDQQGKTTTTTNLLQEICTSENFHIYIVVNFCVFSRSNGQDKTFRFPSDCVLHFSSSFKANHPFDLAIFRSIGSWRPEE